VTARCTALSWTWCRPQAPLRGQRDIRVEANTGLPQRAERKSKMKIKIMKRIKSKIKRKTKTRPPERSYS
jgi:hypothetical protein